MRKLMILAGACAVVAGSTLLEAGTSALLELKVGEEAHVGRLLAKDDSYCWLMKRDGRVQEIELNAVTDFRKVSPKFRRFRSVELRDELRREFGSDYEIAATTHYLCCAAPGKAADYAEIFEQVYRNFQLYFSTRGFRVSQPEFPLVAIVFPDRAAFAKYCRQDDIPPSASLLGYYLRTSNRVALYTLPGDNQQRVEDTIVHEATHQVAFNTGLHVRIGENPKWIVEGLATVFEAPGVRHSTSRGKAHSRINRERYVWFGNFSQSRREEKSLVDFIADDSMFHRSALDAYSQSWALTFFLIETRPSQYAAYLKTVASRDPLTPYDREDRIADFRAAFGDDLDWLETTFLRFVKKLD